MNEPKMFFKISLALQTLAFVIGTPYPVKKFMKKNSKTYTAYMERLCQKVVQESNRMKNVQYTNHGAE